MCILCIIYISAQIKNTEPALTNFLDRNMTKCKRWLTDFRDRNMAWWEEGHSSRIGQHGYLTWKDIKEDHKLSTGSPESEAGYLCSEVWLPRNIHSPTTTASSTDITVQKCDYHETFIHLPRRQVLLTSLCAGGKKKLKWKQQTDSSSKPHRSMLTIWSEWKRSITDGLKNSCSSWR